MQSAPPSFTSRGLRRGVAALYTFPPALCKKHYTTRSTHPQERFTSPLQYRPQGTLTAHGAGRPLMLSRPQHNPLSSHPFSGSGLRVDLIGQRQPYILEQQGRGIASSPARKATMTNFNWVLRPGDRTNVGGYCSSAIRWGGWGCLDFSALPFLYHLIFHPTWW